MKWLRAVREEKYAGECSSEDDTDLLGSERGKSPLRKDGPIKGFHVMEWLRGVRDANYERLGHLSTAEYFHQLSEEGRQTDLWKALEEKAAIRRAAQQAATEP